MSSGTAVIALHGNQKTGQRWRLQIQNWCDVGKARGKWPRQTPAASRAPAPPRPTRAPRGAARAGTRCQRAVAGFNNSAGDQLRRASRLPLSSPRPTSRPLTRAVAHLLHFLSPLFLSPCICVSASRSHSLGGSRVVYYAVFGERFIRFAQRYTE